MTQTGLAIELSIPSFLKSRVTFPRCRKITLESFVSGKQIGNAPVAAGMPQIERQTMRLSISTLTILSVLFASVTLHADDAAAAPEGKAEADKDSSLKRVRGWLKQFENTQMGVLPETFVVRIDFSGYLSRKTKDGIQFYRPREVYEFTPKEVRRFCVRAGGHTYKVAATKPFTKIDHVCRILLALDYLEMVDPDENTTDTNFHYLQVMTDSGLDPAGGAGIQIKSAGTELSYCESCLFGSSTSAQSIRFAALYHTLRRLARSELDLSANDWDDALDVIDVDGSVKRAAGTFRARD